MSKKKLQSILPPEMKGVMFISGYRGKGKTFLAAQADFPPNIAFFDFEDKGEGVDSQLDFGYYKALSQGENNPIARGKLLLKVIHELQLDKYTVAIFDNIRPLEDALLAMVKNDVAHYAQLYGKNNSAVASDSYGAMRGIANDLISDAILKPLYEKGIRLVIVTSHVKSVYEGQGKMRVQGKDRWQELSILTLILVDGDNYPVPSAIVQKEQLASVVTRDDYTDEEIEAIMRGDEPSHIITRRLPYRMPEATFQKLRWYLNNPAQLDNPEAGEKLVESEVKPFDEQLSKEQIAIQLLLLERQKKQDEELRALEVTLEGEVKSKLKQKAIALDSEGMSRKQILEELRNEDENLKPGDINNFLT